MTENLVDKYFSKTKKKKIISECKNKCQALLRQINIYIYCCCVYCTSPETTRDDVTLDNKLYDDYTLDTLLEIKE